MLGLESYKKQHSILAESELVRHVNRDRHRRSGPTRKFEVKLNKYNVENESSPSTQHPASGYHQQPSSNQNFKMNGLYECV
jgi:hypothetical protein